MSKRTKLSHKKIMALTTGVISLDMFNIKIPVFTDNENMKTFLVNKGFDYLDVGKAIYGLAGWAENDEGHRIFYILITPQADCTTWAHEASHIIDMIFDHLGIETGIEVTEVRAYMMGHIFGELSDIMEKRVQAEYSLEPQAA